jgi:hypothetical protein
MRTAQGTSRTGKTREQHVLSNTELRRRLAVQGEMVSSELDTHSS